MKHLNTSEKLKSRGRRLRKKLRVGEFTEYGFSLDITFDKLKIQFDEAIDNLIEFLEMNHWMFGGGGNGNSSYISGFICKFGQGTLTQEDGLLMDGWLKNQGWVTEFTIHDLQDVWHE